MRRTIAAVLIFVFALGFSAYCEIYSARVTQTLCGSAQALKQQALAETLPPQRQHWRMQKNIFPGTGPGLRCSASARGLGPLPSALRACAVF